MCECLDYTDGSRYLCEACAQAHRELIVVAEAAATFVRDSYRPSPKYDAERFDTLREKLIQAGFDVGQPIPEF